MMQPGTIFNLWFTDVYVLALLNKGLVFRKC